MPFIIDDEGKQLWSPKDEEKRQRAKSAVTGTPYVAPYQQQAQAYQKWINKNKDKVVPIKPGVNRAYMSARDTDQAAITQFVKSKVATDHAVPLNNMCQSSS